MCNTYIPVGDKTQRVFLRVSIEYLIKLSKNILTFTKGLGNLYESSL